MEDMKEKVEAIIQEYAGKDPFDGTTYIHSNQFEELTQALLKLFENASIH